MKKLLLPLLALAGFAPGFASSEAKAPVTQPWSFQGPLGTYDRASLQRGFLVYREVCSACHGLQLLTFNDLSAPGGPGFSAKEVEKIAASISLPAGPDEAGDEFDDNGARLMRPARPFDRIPSPFANEGKARAANNGALPPDLSLIVKARRGGPDYVYSIVTGFAEKPPHGFKPQEGMYFNPYFNGWNIAMTPPLTEDAVSYPDGTKATLAQEARDVTTFLAWASDPKLEERHRLGFEATAFLVLFAGLMFLSMRRVWREEK